MVGTTPTRTPVRRQAVANRCIPETDFTIRMAEKWASLPTLAMLKL
jgi:hypothetical protein